MKALVIVITFLFALVVCAECEKILMITGDQTQTIQSWLDKGWTVKHQSIAASGNQSVKDEYCFCLITLSPPTPEALGTIVKKQEQEAERRKAEFTKKREAYLKEQEAKNKVETDVKAEPKK